MTATKLLAPHAPILLAPNTLPSFYPGAGRVAAFRRDPDIPEQHPEDWIASTTTRTGMGLLGLSRLRDRTLLTDRFAADPQGWFGAEHIRRHGQHPALLIKLLDAGQRLPVHSHPNGAFAKTHLGSEHGKTEAWLVLHADAGAGIRLGFSRDVSEGELADWVLHQRVDDLLDACNHIPVRAGDVLLCPAGVPHAIGAGVLVVELQEPSDLSIILEWSGYPIDSDSVFLGLDPDLALASVHREAIAGSDLADLSGRVIRPLSDSATGGTELLPTRAQEFFTAEHIVARGAAVELDPRFGVLIVHDGDGELDCREAPSTPITRGQTLLIPHAAGPITVRGEVSVLRCSPAGPSSEDQCP